MTKMLSALRNTASNFESSVKLLLTLFMVATLSACGSIRYNGITNANTVFDIFSFSENEEQTEQAIAATEEDQQAEQQRAQLLQQQQAKLAEQPGADTYQRLAEGNVLPENKVNQAADVDQQASEQQTLQARTQAAREVAVNAMNSAQTDGTQEMTQADNTQEMNDAKSQAVVVSEPALAENNQTTVLVSSSAVSSSASSDAEVIAEAAPESSETDIAAVEDINRITEENPTAAMVSDYQVLPEVSAKADLSVPNEILLLATPAEYRPEVSEYGMWKIAKGDDSLYRENCTLASATMQVSFDNYSTQVWLSVVGDDLLVNSTTNIDINRPRVGIKLDNGPLLPFTKKHFATNAVWAGNLDAALKRNKKLSVVLSGNEIGNRVQEVSVELDDLKRAYSEYSKCNATTRVGSL